jgi:putative dimethyl sulfoxide reductase chaperone
MSKNRSPDLEPRDLATLAQTRSSFYEFLCIPFLNLPDANFIQQLRDSSIWSVSDKLTVDLDVHPDIAEGWNRMHKFLEESRCLPIEELTQAIGVDRTRLYRGVSANFGPPPPYEALWTGEGADEISILSGVMAVYRDAGLAPGPELNERVDYVGTELDYLRQMTYRETKAWETGHVKEAKKILHKEKLFVKSMNEWFPRFLIKATEFAETEMYRGHMQMLKGFLAEEVKWLEELIVEMESANRMIIKVLPKLS